MLRLRTLNQRFGLLYVIIATILVGVSLVVTVHLRAIRVDSERLVEEAREQTVVARLLSEIDTLATLLRGPKPLESAEVEPLTRLLRKTRSELIALEGSAEDPSRDEHQDAERELATELESTLAEADERLRSPQPNDRANDRAAVQALLGEARHYAQVLHAEAREEAGEAKDDLEERTSLTGLLLAATWASSLVLITTGLVIVHRSMFRPLRDLKSGAERFGRGEREHRIPVQGDDEVSDLARSFNEMADRLARSQDELEERVRARTREFLRAARLADLGVLASGIAHEINTPLASIASSAEGLERRAREGRLDGELLEDYTRIIGTETRRARDITTRMLSLVRQEPSDVTSFPLQLVTGQAVLALRHRAVERGVTVESQVDDAPVRANPGELTQVLVNLLANAIDASREGGRVELEARVRDGELSLSVADRGPGIPEENLERIFEPFFTTKSPGAGTGLGLALVATMIESHDGTVSAENRPDGGAVFTVRVPAEWSRR